MTMEAMQQLVEAILTGDSAEAATQARLLRQSGASAEDIILTGVEPAMGALDAKCTLEQFNLLEIMLSGRAVTEVMKVVAPPGEAPPATKATVVVCSLEGDIHDLGKNILKMVLTGNGYDVVDAGKDCPMARLLDVAEARRPVAIGISGLITQVIPQVRSVRGALASRGLADVRVLAGGAALKQSTAESLDVDFVADSAFDGLHFIEGLAADGG